MESNQKRNAGKTRSMTDKNNNLLLIGDWVSYKRYTQIASPTIFVLELGKITGFTQHGVFMAVKGGTFFCDAPHRLELLTDEQAMLKRLEQ
jgi:hypothetical protein